MDNRPDSGFQKAATISSDVCEPGQFNAGYDHAASYSLHRKLILTNIKRNLWVTLCKHAAPPPPPQHIISIMVLVIRRPAGRRRHEGKKNINIYFQEIVTYEGVN